jgi:N-acetylmuramoyl-L-alanine amidase
MKKTSKFFLILTAIVSFAFIKPGKSEPRQINVVIDAGHGGHDFGATSNSIMEKHIVQQITNKINSLNQNKNIVIHLTRNSDDFVTLSNRTTIINRLKPDLVLSLHANANPDKNKSGVELFVSKESKSYDTSNQIAKNLNEILSKNNTLKTTGVKNANFYILKKSEAPSVIIELGYLTNENDQKYLTDQKEQDRIAESIIEFISELK